MNVNDSFAVLAAVELPEEVTKDISTAFGWIAGIAAAVCIAKIMFVGARMAWDHKHTAGLESPTIAEFAAALAGWVLASAAAIGLAVVLIDAGRIPENSGPPPEKPSLVDDIQQKYPPLEEEK